MDPETPPDSTATPPPAGGPARQAPRAVEHDTAGVGLRVGAGVLAFVIGIVCAVAVAVMVDVGDTPLCEDVTSARQLVGGYECYDFSGSVKPVVVGAGWIGAVLAGIAAILALAFAVRGRGGRMFLGTTVAAAVFLAISIVAAQV
ncbi:MAG: hypothetical protein R2718_04805 [Solirubrobacterales bacterium]